MNIESTEVVFQGVLTIVCRAFPTPPGDVFANFSNECVASARKALELHEAAATKYRISNELWQIYTNW